MPWSRVGSLWADLDRICMDKELCGVASERIGALTQRQWHRILVFIYLQDVFSVPGFDITPIMGLYQPWKLDLLLRRITQALRFELPFRLIVGTVDRANKRIQLHLSCQM